MKKHCNLLVRIQFIFLVTILALTTLYKPRYSIAAGPAVYVVPFRGLDSLSLAQFCYRGLTNCETIDVSTEEFSNGNTFVRYNVDVAGHHVAVPYISSIVGRNANSLMELLIKIRTARTLGATRISVITDGHHLSNDPERHSFIENLIEISGATDISQLRNGRLSVVKSYLGKITFRQQYSNLPSLPTSTNSVVISDSHMELATTIANELGISTFARNYQHITGSSQVFLVTSMVDNVNHQFFKTLIQIERLKQSGHQVILVTPYLPYARSDKIDQPGVTVTGKLIADLIESAGTDAIAFARLHAPQSQGFFNIPTIHVFGRATINAELKEQGIQAVISPDAGFQKEASLYADELGVPVYVVNKQRDPITGQSALKKMGTFDVTGQTVAVIDDETATGGTLAQVADFLKNLGAKKVIAVVTHLAGDAKKALGADSIDKLIVTNTYPVSVATNKLKVISIGEEISDGLRRLLPSASNCIGALVRSSRINNGVNK